MNLKDKKHVLLLIAAAIVVSIVTILYSIFDSPKYNSLQAYEITTTQAKETYESISSDDKININTADVSQLSQLDQIGEKKALAIIEYREKNGAFRSPYELTNISGISQSIVEINIDKIIL